MENPNIDQCTINNNEKQDALEEYKLILDFLKFEATMLWQIFSVFLVAHTIFLSFIGVSIADKKIDEINFVLLLLLGVVGLILAVLWLGTFSGNSKWYYYRMKRQAKVSERKYVKYSKDKNWFLLNQDSEKVKSLISNKNAGYGMIITFIICYFLIVIWSLIKINCN